MKFQSLKNEWLALKKTASSLDKQAIFVMIACIVLMFIQQFWGGRRFYNQNIVQYFPEDWQGIGEWAWWFGLQGITGFLLPVFFLMIFFKRRPAEIGLGLGDWRFAIKLAGLYLPLVVIGTWILSDGSDFQRIYPHYQPAARDWTFFLIYEALFLFYWMGWEYLWRGFVLFGTAPALGIYAIFVQTIPFALLHANKPMPEAFLSILGGVALGALVWRCRSFWIAVPIHAFQMFMLDLWCTMRIRSGSTGYGLDALWTALFE